MLSRNGRRFGILCEFAHEQPVAKEEKLDWSFKIELILSDTFGFWQTKFANIWILFKRSLKQQLRDHLRNKK